MRIIFFSKHHEQPRTKKIKRELFQKQTNEQKNKTKKLYNELMEVILRQFVANIVSKQANQTLNSSYFPDICIFTDILASM